MKNTASSSFLLIFCFLLLGSCWGGSSEKEDKVDEVGEELEDALNDSKEDIEKGIKSGVDALKDAIKDIEKAVTDANNGEKIEPVNFRELKELMPDKFAGLPRTKNSGETTGTMGFKISKAEARFEEEGQSIDVDIIDVGGMGIALLGMAAWTALDIDKESDDGYERSTTFEGHKAYEKYNSKTGRGELNILVNKRFIVQVKFRGPKLDMDDVKKQLRRMDLDDLEDFS